MHGLHNAVLVVWLPAGQSLQNTLDGPGAHGDGEHRGNANKGSRHGVIAKAGNEAWQGRCGPATVAQQASM